jgi:hypothetical protein
MRWLEDIFAAASFVCAFCGFALVMWGIHG